VKDTLISLVHESPTSEEVSAMRPDTRHGPCCTACGQPLGYRTTDKLTGLLDRWAWDEAAAHILDQVGAQPAVLLMVDLDRFKDVNDTHGHLAGDAVLRAAASVVRGAVRQMDVVGRYGGHGGDEFLVLLPATDRERGEKVANRVLTQIRAAAVSAPSARDGMVTLTGLTASIGLAARDHNPDHDLAMLFQGADAALLHAKHTGRDRVAVTDVSEDAVPSFSLRPGETHMVEWHSGPADYETVVATQLRTLLRMLPGEEDLGVLAALSCGPQPYADLTDVGSGLDRTVPRLERAGLVTCDRVGEEITCCSLTLAARELLDKLLPAMEWAGKIGLHRGRQGVSG
jgi:diguanylate cyclase (GGDEF)-like protein